MSLTVAMVCGLFIAQVYRWSYRGTSYSASYVRSLVAFAMITTIVIMVIGNNLARAFGLVGSMSIVRFRMAIKDTKDIVFIFFTLSIGMACGVGQHMVAAAATLYISIIILILSHSNFSSPQKRDYLLQFNFESGSDDDTPYVAVLSKFCRKFRLINMKSVGDTNIIELSYYITLKKIEAEKDLVRQIGHIPGISNINFFFDED